jgi:hypothetical protein
MGLVDKRRAVEITVTLSSQLIAAALAMLAVEGALVTYALAERVVHPAFPWVISISFLSFAASIFVAGKGITEARDKGFEGKWHTLIGRNKFNWQAICLLIGLSLFAISAAVSGPTRKTLIDEQLHDMQAEVCGLKTQVEGFEQEFRIIATEVAEQRLAVDSVQEELGELSELVLRVINKIEKESDGVQP